MSAASPAPAGSQRRILVADVDQAQLVQIKDGLRHRGFDIRTAIDGSKALEMALTLSPDVVVLGMDLPVVPTKRIMDILSTNPKTRHVPVLLMASKPVQIKKLGLEPTDHLVKPVHVEALLDRIFKITHRNDKLRDVDAKTKEFQGNLSQISIGDLLQILSLNKKDGSVQLERAGQVGYIYLQAGQIINASLGKIEGEKALYRLLGWHDGKFDYTPDKALSPVRIRTSIENLLMEGMRHLDETQKLADKLPGPGAHLALNVDPANLPTGLKPITQELLLLLEFYSRMQDLVDNCMYPDFEVYQNLATLLAKDIVKVVDARSSGKQTTLLSIPQIQQLYNVLVGFRKEKPIKAQARILLLSHDARTAIHFLNHFRLIEGFQTRPEVHHREGRPFRLGPLGTLALGDQVDIEFLSLPVDRLSSPLWQIYRYNALGGFLIFDRKHSTELAELQRAHRFFTEAGLRLAPVNLTSGAENATQDEKKIRKVLGLGRDEPVHHAASRDSSTPVPDLVKTMLMHAIN